MRLFASLARLRPHCRQRVRGRHVGANLPHRPDGKLGLRKVVSPSGLGVGNGLADDVLKVAVHDHVKGVMLSLYQPGPYSPIKEELVEHFVAWYMERIAA